MEYYSIKRNHWAESMAHVVENLPSEHKDLSSTSSNTKKRKIERERERKREGERDKEKEAVVIHSMDKPQNNYVK
jgi:hypothetical protein